MSESGHPQRGQIALRVVGAGVSAFLRDGDEVFHTYATYGRGVEVMMHAYRLLDITALGRHEEWEEPKGRVPAAHPADPGFTS